MSYSEYKKIWNQRMKDQLFKKRVEQSFAMEEIEALGVDRLEDMSVISTMAGGTTTGSGSRGEGGAKEANLFGQEEKQSCRSKPVILLYNQRGGRLKEQSACITCAARHSAKA